MVGDNRSRVGFFASATWAPRDPLVPGLLPFTKETDAHPGRLPLAVPVRGRLGFGIFGVEHTPVVPMRFVYLSVPVLTSSSWLQAPAFSEGHRAGSAVAIRSRSEA